MITDTLTENNDNPPLYDLTNKTILLDLARAQRAIAIRKMLVNNIMERYQKSVNEQLVKYNNLNWFQKFIEDCLRGNYNSNRNYFMTMEIEYRKISDYLIRLHNNVTHYCERYVVKDVTMIKMDILDFHLISDYYVP